MIRQEVGRLEKFFDRRRVWVTSHTSPIGAAVVRRLWQERCDILLSSAGRPDLANACEVARWVRTERPDVIFLTAHPPAHAGRGRTADVAGWMPPRLAATRNLLSAAQAGGVATVVDLLAASRAPEGDGADFAHAARRLTLSSSRNQACRFIALAADRLSGEGRASDLLRLHRRMREAVCRGERELEVDRLDVSEILPMADDIADAACFLAPICRGTGLVRLVPEDFGTVEQMAALVAESAGYEGQIHVLQPRVTADAVTMRMLGWRPAVPLRDRIRSLCDAWTPEGSPLGVLN